MSARTIYRVCIWLPIAIPIALIAAVNAFDWRHDVGTLGQLIAYSLVYGGLPYLGLAIWATWWVGQRPESQIRRLMFRAPLLMVAIFATLALVVGVAVGGLEQWAAVALLGGVVTLFLGYGYVALTVLLRFALGPRSA